MAKGFVIGHEAARQECGRILEIQEYLENIEDKYEMDVGTAGR